MNTQYPQNLKTNEFGEVDVSYYIAKGRQLRSLAIAEMLRSFIAKLKSRRAKTPHLPLKANFRH
jgi:hypothetical protein